ncbi:MAG: hypothetical protein RBU45_10985 [Myxococcota bacterium]|nr:hypothetical protein [Myxococcota bacterium]
MRRVLDLALAMALATSVAGFVGCSDDEPRRTGEGEGEGEGAEGEGEGAEGEGAEGEGAEGEGEGAEGEGEGAEGEGEGAEGEGEGAEGEGEGAEGEGEGAEGEGEGAEGCAQCGTCPPADGELQDFGGYCGPTRSCNYNSRDYPDCLNEQCKGPDGEDGFCLDGFCTKQCAAADDCLPSPTEAWVDGPQGANFVCWGTSSSVAFCFPSTAATILECEADVDCREGESCNIGYSRDFRHLIGLCLTDVKCGAAPGEDCNDDPLAGDLIPCKNHLCFGDGKCNAICAEDEDCDWSGILGCQTGLVVSDSFPNDTFGFCFGKECTLDADCGDTDLYWCNPIGMLNEDNTEILGTCEEILPADGPKYGDECNDDTLDEIPDVDCAQGLCLGGTCAGGCETKEDCGDGYTCYDVNVCIDEDCDETLPVGFCIEWPGSAEDCTLDTDCPDGENCSLYTYDTDEMTVSFKCTTNVEDGVGYGESCGGPSDIECYNGYCFGAEGEPGFCSMPCTENTDCGAGFLCIDMLLTDDSDLTASFCYQIEGSMDPCGSDEHFTCEAEGEICYTLPDGEEVDYLCVAGEGAEAAAGEECESQDVCLTGLCLFDGTGDKGYCSALCDEANPCAGEGYECVSQAIEEGDEPLTVGRCAKTAACTLCGNGFPSCAGGYACTYTTVELEDGPLTAGTCAKPCVEAGDCTDVKIGDVATTCADVLGPDGEPSGSKACLAADMLEACGYISVVE